MSSPNNKTFVKITNRDIFEKLETLETHVVNMGGKIKLNKWIAGVALTIALAAFGIRFI